MIKYTSNMANILWTVYIYIWIIIIVGFKNDHKLLVKIDIEPSKTSMSSEC